MRYEQPSGCGERLAAGQAPHAAVVAVDLVLRLSLASPSGFVACWLAASATALCIMLWICAGVTPAPAPPDPRSIGTGNTIVDDASPDTSTSVW